MTQIGGRKRLTLDEWVERANALIAELGVEKAQLHPDLTVDHHLLEEFPEL